MVATFWDHGLVVVAFVVVFPLVGWWSHRRFVERAAVEGEAALIREYRQTIFVWLGGLLLATLALWIGQWRPLGALFVVEEGLLGPGLAFGAAVGVAVGVVVRPILALTSRRAAAGLAEAMGTLGPFLPRSGRALRWGTAVSIVAGVAATTALGALFAVIFVSTGSLALPMLLHALINVSSMVTAYLVLRPRG